MSSSDPTLNELDALLAEISIDPGPRGITTVEICAARGIGPEKAKDRIIRPLVQAGKLKATMVVRGPQDGPYWLREAKVQGYVRV